MKREREGYQMHVPASSCKKKEKEKKGEKAFPTFAAKNSPEKNGVRTSPFAYSFTTARGEKRRAIFWAMYVANGRSLYEEFQEKRKRLVTVSYDKEGKENNVEYNKIGEVSGPFLRRGKKRRERK